MLCKFSSFSLNSEKLEVRKNSSKLRGDVCLSLEQDDSSGEVSDLYLEMFESNFGQEAKYSK